jgi:hypothetical protein
MMFVFQIAVMQYELVFYRLDIVQVVPGMAPDKAVDLIIFG